MQWTPEQQEQMRLILKDEAAQVALRVGASHCFVAAFWEEPGTDIIHQNFGGSSPWPLSYLFERLALRYRDIEEKAAAAARGESKH